MTMLTREQLQTAARYLCKVRNIHPDNQELLKPEPAHGVAVYTTALENVMRELTEFELLTEAIRYGKEATGRNYG
jgi:hypothetical protein